MKPAEFSEIMISFVEEQKRWLAFKVGDIIYERMPREFDFDYHKMEIDSVDIEERQLVAHDVAGGAAGETKIVSDFLTEDEFKNSKY